MVKFVDDVPCPCCSTSVTCNAEPGLPAVPFTAILHDSERYSELVSFGNFTSREIHKDTTEFALPSTEPPSKIPLYISNLNLIR
jgi:hypothetical protein